MAVPSAGQSPAWTPCPWRGDKAFPAESWLAPAQLLSLWRREALSVGLGNHMLHGFNMRSLFLVCWFVRHTWMWGRGLSDHHQPGTAGCRYPKAHLQHQEFLQKWLRGAGGCSATGRSPHGGHRHPLCTCPQTRSYHGGSTSAGTAVTGSGFSSRRFCWGILALVPVGAKVLC